jgi:hypothetical protein
MRPSLRQFACRLEYMLHQAGLSTYNPYCPYWLRAVSAMHRLTTSTLIPLRKGIGECLRHHASHGCAPVRSDWYYAPEAHRARVEELKSHKGETFYRYRRLRVQRAARWAALLRNP